MSGAQELAALSLTIPIGTPPGVYRILLDRVEAGGAHGEVPGDVSVDEFLIHVHDLPSFSRAWRTFQQSGTVAAGTDLNIDLPLDHEDADQFLQIYLQSQP